MAERQGLALRKSRRRDPRATDYDAYRIINPTTNALVSPELGMNLDEVERYLTEDKYEYKGFRILGPHHHPEDPDPATSGWLFNGIDDRPILEWARDPAFSTPIYRGHRSPPEGWRLWLVDGDMYDVGGTRDDLDWAIKQAADYVASKHSDRQPALHVVPPATAKDDQ